MIKWLGHLKTVLLHKFWVFRYSLLAGIPWRGLFHDMSKFSPTEFCESARFYKGARSPIYYTRQANNFSKAWLHHRGRNSHHFEYWIDNPTPNYLIVLPMPFKFALELICDRLSAGRAYQKQSFSMKKQLERFDQELAPSPIIHPQTKRFIQLMFEALDTANNFRDELHVFRQAKKFYAQAWDETVVTDEPAFMRVEYHDKPIGKL